MSIRVASTALLIVAVAGCRGEMDGTPVAQLGAEQPAVSAPARRGDAERVADLPATDAAAGVLHPDGRTIAYLAGQLRGEIWALDGIGAGEGLSR